MFLDGEDDKNGKFKFGIYGLKNKSELLQVGDPVRFQIDSKMRAVNVVALRDKSRATVDSMKGKTIDNKSSRSSKIVSIGRVELFFSPFFFLFLPDQYGFLSYIVDEGRKLFFHSSQVKDKTPLQPGDLVEFVLVTNQRTGKSSAYNVVKIR